MNSTSVSNSYNPKEKENKNMPNQTNRFDSEINKQALEEYVNGLNPQEQFLVAYNLPVHVLINAFTARYDELATMRNTLEKVLDERPRFMEK